LAAAPKISRQLVIGSLDTPRPGAIALLAGGDGLLDGHIGVPKADHPFLTVLTAFDDELLSALYIPSRTVAGEVAGVHLQASRRHFQSR
jgi:hypothetical protein